MKIFNLEQHREIIKWWCDNSETGVMVKHPNKKWIEDNEPMFMLGSQYIRNDEFVEFRKAKCDGHIVETYNYNGGWVIMDDDMYIKKTEYYRIIPKCKFKVGEYVQFTDSHMREKYSSAYRITKIINPHNILIGEFEGHNDENELELWYPSEGEVCYFLSNKRYTAIAVVGVFVKMWDNKYVTSKGYSYDRCIPASTKIPEEVLNLVLQKEQNE